MPAQIGYATKEFTCSKCKQPITKGTEYYWRITSYKVHNRTYRECVRWHKPKCPMMDIIEK